MLKFLNVKILNKKEVGLYAMKKIILSSEKHHGKKVLSIQFGYNDEEKNHLKKIKNVYWNRTLRGFHTKFTLSLIHI